MVVEDAADARTALVRLLRMEGYEALPAVDARDALVQLEALGESRPDLILLDICMPEMDGLTFLSIIRSDPRWKGVTVLMWTAHPDGAQFDRAAQLGVAGFISKGFDSWDRMLARVQAALPV